MLARLIKAREENEEGFTLIELLVVIIIIGILAAIAIPVFLSQRKKGYDSAAKSDLRNMATAEESYLTDYDVYLGDAQSATFPSACSGDTFASQCLRTLEGAKKSNNVGDIVAEADAPAPGNLSDGYCMGVKSRSGNVFWYDSENGGLLNIAQSSKPTTGACGNVTLTNNPAFP